MARPGTAAGRLMHRRSFLRAIQASLVRSMLSESGKGAPAGSHLKELALVGQP